MLTPLKACHCYSCQSLIWRVAIAARNIESQGISAGQVFPLWPRPDSLYAEVRNGMNVARGIAFCHDCAPKIDDEITVLATAKGETYTLSGPVIGLESALGRYSDWYSDERGEFFRTWLRDALSLEPSEIDALMALWIADRNGRYVDPDHTG